MATKFDRNITKSLNSLKSNDINLNFANSPKFNVPSKSMIIDNTRSFQECRVLPGDVISFDAKNTNSDNVFAKYPQVCTERMNTRSWLQKYGLHPNKLTIEQILTNIGFKYTKGTRFFKLNVFLTSSHVTLILDTLLHHVIFFICSV
jgi:hypothetical protein